MGVVLQELCLSRAGDEAVVDLVAFAASYSRHQQV